MSTIYKFFKVYAKIIKKGKIPFFVFIILTIISSCNRGEQYIKTEGGIWNTLYHITYKGPSSLQDSILPVLNEVSRSLSVFDKNSLVTELNNGNKVRADYHLTMVYNKSKEINEKSQRRFDPTVSPLIDAWGFGLGHTPNADTLAIDSLLTFVGLNKTEMTDGFIIKYDSRIRFNFSAIAKGYGCDALGEMFKRNGVNDYMVEIGGELTLGGKSPSGNDWKIAIDAPVEDYGQREEAVLIISITDVGVATSGNYRNFRKEAGIKTAHTISPVTGRPYASEILSATVIANSCMEADAIATACMAGTPQEARELFGKCNVEGLLIMPDSIWMTSGFEKFITSPISEPGRITRN